MDKATIRMENPPIQRIGVKSIVLTGFPTGFSIKSGGLVALTGVLPLCVPAQMRIYMAIAIAHIDGRQRAIVLVTIVWIPDNVSGVGVYAACADFAFIRNDWLKAHNFVTLLSRPTHVVPRCGCAVVEVWARP